MTNEQLRRLAEEVFAACLRELEDKGADYCTDDNRLANFEAGNDRLKVSPRQNWGVGFKKQVDAVMSWAGGKELRSEPLIRRIIDVINYGVLGAGLEINERAGSPDQADALIDALFALHAPTKDQQRS